MNQLAVMESKGVTPGPPPSHRFDFRGTMGEFFGIFIKNFFLTLVTLGIYAPWAKTETRKFLWSSTEFHGHRFEWHGTGLELFKGYARVFAIFALYSVIMAAVQGISRDVALVAQLLAGIGIGVLIPYAIFWAFRYRLSRTAWRGIRMAADPAAGEYAKAFIQGYLLTVLTIGLYTPFWQNSLYAIRMNNARFGTEHLSYDGQGSDVFKIWIKGVFLSLITVGLYLPWMWTEIASYRWSHTRFGKAQGKLNLEGTELFGLIFTNLLLVLLTLGLAGPFLMVRNAKFFLSRVEFQGEIDFKAIEAKASQSAPSSDSLADSLDVGIEI